MFGACSSSQQLQLLAILPIERQGPWLDACLLCGGGRDLQITQVASAQDAAAALRHGIFDLLVFWQERRGKAVLETWDQLSQLTNHEGFVALGMQIEEGWNEPLIGAGAIACLDMDHIDPMTLVHALRTAVELERLRSESQSWEQERDRRRQREAREIDRALASQRSLLDRLDYFGAGPIASPEEDSHVANQPDLTSLQERGRLQNAGTVGGDLLATAEGQQYLAALQNFIFDENQTASSAVAALAEHFVCLGATSSSIMRVHLTAVTRVTAGGGPGSLRHCLSGADRFLMELLMRVIDQQGSSGGAAPNGNVRLHSVASPLAAA